MRKVALETDLSKADIGIAKVAFQKLNKVSRERKYP